MRAGSTASLGLKGECLELLNHLAEVPQALAQLEQEGVIPSVLMLVQTPDVGIEASAAELLAKLAQVKAYQLQISRESDTTLPTLIELLHSSSAAAQLAGLHALIELLFDHLDNQLVATTPNPNPNPTPNPNPSPSPSPNPTPNPTPNPSPSPNPSPNSNQVAMRAGVVEPAVRLARSEDR